MDKNRLNQQFEFIRTIDKEKMIKRQTLLTDKQTFEDDAQHAWHASIMALLLSEYANEKIDLLKTISMLLIHDLVEIQAGDTYAYDEVNKQTQRQRELEAANNIFGLLPENQALQFRKLWDEFEAQESNEAKFARAMDCIQPMVLNDASDGKMWIKNQVRLSQVLKRNEKIPSSSTTLWDYVYESIIIPNVEKGRIINDKEEQK